MRRGVRICLVGVGSFDREFVQLFRDHPLVERLALCDLDPDRINSAVYNTSIGIGSVTAEPSRGERSTRSPS